MPNLGMTIEHLLKRTKTLKQTGLGLRVTRKAVARPIVNSVRGLQNYERYFIVVEDETDCSKPFQRRSPSFMQIRMLCNGERLSDYARNIEGLLKNWLSIQIYIAKGLALLHSNGLVHGDIRCVNILISDSRPYIINFQHGFMLKDATYTNLDFMPDNNNYAPELDYAAGFANGLNSDSIIQKIFEKKHILEEVDEVFARSLSAEALFKRFAAVNAPDQVLQKYGFCSDMWSLGYELYTLYKRMISSSYVVNSSFYRQCHRDQMRILGSLLHPDPRQRLTADMLLTELFTIKMDFNE